MIAIEKEKSSLGFPVENCCFCDRGTRFWSKAKDVPVCKSCAMMHMEWHVPSKQEWALPRGQKTRNSISSKNTSLSKSPS